LPGSGRPLPALDQLDGPPGSGAQLLVVAGQVAQLQEAKGEEKCQQGQAGGQQADVDLIEGKGFLALISNDFLALISNDFFGISYSNFAHKI
jgi:hypothetical protein